jgi:hypothetical protein
LRVLAGAALVAALVVGCQGENELIVINRASTQIRVFIELPGGGIATVTPSPGSGSYVAVTRDGAYRAGGIVDAEWLERIGVERQVLEDMLADPQRRRRLTPAELSQIATRIGDLNTEIRRTTERPSDNVAGCSGVLDVRGSSLADVSAATVEITDNPTGGSPPFVLICS